MCDPHSLAPVDLHSDARTCSRDDNVGAFSSNCGGLAKNAISDRLANTYLCVRACTRQSRIGHALACGRSVLELMPFSGQIGSEQVTLIVCVSCPGATVISRLTSRNPYRVPTTVYLPGRSSISRRAKEPKDPMLEMTTWVELSDSSDSLTGLSNPGSSISSRAICERITGPWGLWARAVSTSARASSLTPGDESLSGRSRSCCNRADRSARDVVRTLPSCAKASDGSAAKTSS